MIHAVFSSDERFKRLELRPGLNILLAERRPDAADNDTRNGVGKSSLISLIHFVLGGNVGKKSIFATDALRDLTFGLDIDIGDRRRLAARVGATPGTVTIIHAPVEERSADLADGEDAARHEPVAPPDEDADEAPEADSHETSDPQLDVEVLELPGMEPEPAPQRIKTSQWLNLLREAWYPGLPEDDGPSTRTLLTYAARQATGGGFEDPFKIVPAQSAGDSQVAVSYLLGLDWSLADAWHDVRKREKNVKALTKALRDGELKSFTVGSVAKLRTQVTLAERRVAELRESASNFQVIPSFGELEIEANRLSREIRQGIDDNVIDRALLDQLRDSYDTELPPAAVEVAAMYEAAGV